MTSHTFRRFFGVVLLFVIVAFLVGYWTGRRGIQLFPERGIVGTIFEIERDTARKTGADIGERAGDIANDVGKAARKLDDVLGDAALTTRIKSKMALDDYVSAARIDIDTKNGIVTLSGRVTSQTERERAVRLARETKDVKSVVDHLEVRQ